jgi:site-specific DNA-methyltransferase (adenine-specific)
MSLPAQILSAKQITMKFHDHNFDVFDYMKDRSINPAYKTDLGALFANDCMKCLPLIKDEVIDTVFADPPFNLGKEYGKNTNDKIPEKKYIEWCKE